MSWEDCGELIDNARVLFEVILWYLSHSAADDVIQCLRHEFVIKSIRVVKVEESLVSPDLLTLLQISVERVLRYVDDMSLCILLIDLPQVLHDLLTNR